VAYLGALIDDVAAKTPLDPKRVFVVGHSNGGFMAHRLACDIGGRIAAIVSLAGMTWLDPSKCPAADPVNVLQVHGDADDSIPYDGSPYFPSAAVTVATWAMKNGCIGANAIGAGGDPIDLVVDLPGAETTKQSYAGCPAGGAVDFWTIHGGSHIPMFDPPVWEDIVWTWMKAHPKP
jgi:polyhydroxybutyrate depolymerase